MAQSHWVHRVCLNIPGCFTCKEKRGESLVNTAPIYRVEDRGGRGSSVKRRGTASLVGSALVSVLTSTVPYSARAGVAVLKEEGQGCGRVEACNVHNVALRTPADMPRT